MKSSTIKCMSWLGPACSFVARDSIPAAIGTSPTSVPLKRWGASANHRFPPLSRRGLGVSALNLGYGGAGPEFFAHQHSLVDYLNGAEAVVLQAMSGRSQSNSMFDSGGLEYLTRRADGARIGADRAYREALDGPAFLRTLGLPGRKLAKLMGALQDGEPGQGNP